MNTSRALALFLAVCLVGVSCSSATQASDATDGGAESESATTEVDGGQEVETAEEADDVADSDDAVDPADADAEPIVDVAVDFGVDDEVIRVGLSIDLSGPLKSIDEAILRAHQAYFARVNENGGIAGRQVELLIEDHENDVPTHLDNYAKLSEESTSAAVMIGLTGGTGQTLAISEDLVDDDLLAVSLSPYSGWSTLQGANIFEMHASACVVAMNSVEFLVDQSVLDSPTLAIVTRPGIDALDSAAGARFAGEALDLEIVDLAGDVSEDQLAEVVSALVVEQPDLVFVALSPLELAQVLGSAVNGGLDALWSGSVGSYDPSLLEAVGPELDQFYFPSATTAIWGTNESSAMADMMDVILAEVPGATYAQADHFTRGWTQALVTEAVLIEAAERNDLTRAGVLAAARAVDVSFGDLAPAQSWSGSMNDSIVRSSFIYNIDLSVAMPSETIDNPGSSGLETVIDNVAGQVAQDHQFDNACFTPTN